MQTRRIRRRPAANCSEDSQTSAHFDAFSITQFTSEKELQRKATDLFEKPHSMSQPTLAKRRKNTFAGPRSSTDIDIHKGKVDELRNTIQAALCGEGPRTILVCGPSGSGKSTCIDVMCRELKCTTVQWDPEESFDLSNKNTVVSSMSELDSFRRFLRGISNSLDGNGNAIKLVRSLPSDSYRDVPVFQKALLNDLTVYNRPVIFCLPDVNSAYEISPQRIFSTIFKQHASIATVSFNPVSQRYMTKAVRKMASQLSITNNLLINDAVNESNGDMRCALNILLFNAREKGKAQSNCKVHPTPTYDLFHMLGRILYAKRIDTKMNEEFPLHKMLLRPEPERDVNYILEMSHSSELNNALFLYEHELNFSPSIKSSRKCFDAISVADSLTGRWEVRALSVVYMDQICARSTMFYNYPNICSSSEKRKMYKFHKPKWYSLEMKIREMTSELKQCTFSSIDRLNLIHMLPLVKAQLSVPQWSIVGYLTRPFSVPYSQDQKEYETKMRQSVNNSHGLRISRTEDSSALLNQYMEDPEDSAENFDIEDDSDISDEKDLFNDSFD